MSPDEWQLTSVLTTDARLSLSKASSNPGWPSWRFTTDRTSPSAALMKAADEPQFIGCSVCVCVCFHRFRLSPGRVFTRLLLRRGGKGKEAGPTRKKAVYYLCRRRLLLCPRARHRLWLPRPAQARERIYNRPVINTHKPWASYLFVLSAAGWFVCKLWSKATYPVF